MPFQVDYTPEAINDLDGMRAYDRSRVLEAVGIHLTVDPVRESKSRIKRLQNIQSPQYRLRVDELRVFYDVEEQNVIIYRILDKETATQYLTGPEGQS